MVARILSILCGAVLIFLVKGLTRELSGHPTVLRKLTGAVDEVGARVLDRAEVGILRAAKRVELPGLERGVSHAFTRGLMSWDRLSEGMPRIGPETKKAEEVYAGLPRSLDWRAVDAQVQDQGGEGACTAYAVVGAMESVLNRSYERAYYKLSEADLWRQYEEPNLKKAVATVMYGHGVLVERRGGSDVTSRGHRVKMKASEVETLRDMGSVVRALAQGRSVVLGVEVTRGLRQSDTGWVGDGSGEVEGGHAMAVVGYRLVGDGAKGSYVIVRNSWGSAWGDEGYGYVPFEYCVKVRCVGVIFGNVF